MSTIHHLRIVLWYLLFLGGGQKCAESTEGKYNIHDMDHIKKTFIWESAIFSRMRKTQRVTIKRNLLLMNMSKII